MKADWTPAWVAEKAAQLGYRWILVQAEDTPLRMVPDIRAACHAKGLLCGVWESEVDYGSPTRAADGYDAYCGQVEGPGQMDRLVQSLPAFRLAFPDMPAATVTTFAGMDTHEKARPLIDAGFACLPESHIRENPNATVERQVDYATRVLKWPAVQPMVGLGAGATLADYPGIEGYAGWSVFSLEYL